VIGLHFLAFPDDPDRCSQREAQASVIKGLAGTALNEGNSVVVLGDLNDFDETVVDAAHNKPISKVLDLIRDPLPITQGDELSNVAAHIKESSQRYSYWYDRNVDCKTEQDELSLIDHVLLSNDLTPFISAAAVDHSYGASCNTYESDHWPVWVRLNLSL